MNNDLLRASSDPEIWKLCAAEMNGVMATIDFESARRLPSATLTERDAQTQRDLAIDAPRKLVSQMRAMEWGSNRMHFTLGQLDTDALVLLAERKTLNWQEIFNAKASFGKPDDLELIRTQALLFGTTINVNNALGHASKPTNMVSGLRFEGNYATTEYLFRQGADPNTDNSGVLFYTVVEQGRSDIGRLFAKFGQNGLLNVESWVNKAKADRKIKLHEELRKIHWEYGRYHVLDNETLQETKLFPDNTGSLRILFNFASRHVTELLELPNPKQVIVKDYSFDDYGQQALESARAKMIDMGATPSGIDLPLRGKSVVPKPATFGLPGKSTTP